MSVFSTVGDVFSDTEFSALGNSFLWGLGAPGDSNRERTGFLIMPKRPYEWRVDSHGCYKYDTRIVTSDLMSATLAEAALIFLSFFICAPPTSQAPTASPAASKLGRGAWNVKPPSTRDGSGDADEHDVVYQDRVSAYLSTPSTATSESLADPLSPTALTRGHFASRLCLCLSLSVGVCVCVSVCVCFEVNLFAPRLLARDSSLRHSRLQRIMLAGAPHMGSLLKQRRCDPRLHTSTSDPSLQPHVCTTQVGTHPVRSSTTYKKECKYRLSGNPQCHRYRPSYGTGDPRPGGQEPHKYHRSDLRKVSCGYSSRSQ